MDQDLKYLNYIQHTFDAWTNISDEYRLHRDAAKPLPSMDGLKKHNYALWAHRLRPPAMEVSDICTHVIGIENYLNLTDLKADGDLTKEIFHRTQ